MSLIKVTERKKAQRAELLLDAARQTAQAMVESMGVEALLEALALRADERLDALDRSIGCLDGPGALAHEHYTRAAELLREAAREFSLAVTEDDSARSLAAVCDDGTYYQW